MYGQLPAQVRMRTDAGEADECQCGACQGARRIRHENAAEELTRRQSIVTTWDKHGNVLQVGVMTGPFETTQWLPEAWNVIAWNVIEGDSE